MKLPPIVDRRQVLRRAAAAASLSWLARSAWSQQRLDANPFLLGVASGSPDASSVVLWTRLTAAEARPLDLGQVTVRWEIGEGGDGGAGAMGRTVRAGASLALPELAHSVHVEAQGLAPDRWYSYRFMVGDWVSPVGRTRTLPEPDAAVQKLRFGYASCQRWEHGYFAAWRHLHADQPDFVLFLGDYIYEYPGVLGALRWPGFGWVSSLEDYRARYALHRTDPDLQRMHAACPWLLTWDDHEVQNDYAGDVPGQSGPPVANHPARKAAAYQAWYEHMPVRASVLTRSLAGLAAGAEMRIHSEFRLGRLGRLLLLDPRQYRDRQACTPGGRHGSGVLDPSGCPEWNDPGRSMLGQAQERWLEDRLAAGGGAWTLLGQSTLFGPRNFAAAPRQSFWNDGWDGYPAARQRLTDTLKKHAVANPVLFGGDVHENWVGHVLADYRRPDSALGVEFCGTSITSRSGPPERAAQVLARNPHFVFADARHRGYGLADLTPARLDVRLRAVERVEDPASPAFTLAAFSVASGQARLERA